MFRIKLYKTYNKIKHILIKPKLKVMLSPMEHQPFYLPPHVFILFDKYSEYNTENDRREYNSYFFEKVRKWIPFLNVWMKKFWLAEENRLRNELNRYCISEAEGIE